MDGENHSVGIRLGTAVSGSFGGAHCRGPGFPARLAGRPPGRSQEDAASGHFLGSALPRPLALDDRLHRRPGRQRGGATCMSIVSLPQDTSGRQTAQDWRSQPSAEPQASAAAEERCSALCSPRLLKFAGPRLLGPGGQSHGSSGGKGQGRRDWVRRLCFQVYPGGPRSQQYMKPRRCEKGKGGVRVVGRGGRLCTPLPTGRGASPARASSRRRWQLGSSPAPDWLTFQCHSRRRSSLLPRLGTGVRLTRPPLCSPSLSAAACRAGAPRPRTPPRSPKLGTLGSTCLPEPGVNASRSRELSRDILILNSHLIAPAPPPY